MMVIVTGYTLLVTSQYYVIIMFAKTFWRSFIDTTCI